MRSADQGRKVRPASVARSHSAMPKAVRRDNAQSGSCCPTPDFSADVPKGRVANDPLDAFRPHKLRLRLKSPPTLHRWAEVPARLMAHFLVRHLARSARVAASGHVPQAPRPRMQMNEGKGLPDARRA